MRLSRQLFRVSGVIARRLDEYSKYSPTSLNLYSLIEFGKNAPRAQSFSFLRHELPIRLANIMKEILLLPDALLGTKPVGSLVEMYEKTFEELLKYESKDCVATNISDFTEAIRAIRERHAPVIQIMAEGIREMKDNRTISLAEEKQVQYFLDRFYMSRIGIRMLINQQGNLSLESRMIGSIDPRCSPLNMACSAYIHATKICSSIYENFWYPKVSIKLHEHGSIPQISDKNFVKATDHPCVKLAMNNILENVLVDTSSCPEGIEFSYIPDHLFLILFELLKNSIRAVVENVKKVESRNLPKINIIISQGLEDIVIRLEDEGYGIPLAMTDDLFRYTFTSCRQLLIGKGENRSPMAGFGHGLPLSRLHARYLSGDLNIHLIEKVGTIAIVALKRHPMESNEILPIFNKTSEKVYTNPQTDDSDWINSDSINSQFNTY